MLLMQTCCREAVREQSSVEEEPRHRIRIGETDQHFPNRQLVQREFFGNSPLPSFPPQAPLQELHGREQSQLGLQIGDCPGERSPLLGEGLGQQEQAPSPPCP